MGKAKKNIYEKSNLQQSKNQNVMTNTILNFKKK